MNYHSLNYSNKLSTKINKRTKLFSHLKCHTKLQHYKSRRCKYGLFPEYIRHYRGSLLLYFLILAQIEIHSRFRVNNVFLKSDYISKYSLPFKSIIYIVSRQLSYHLTASETERDNVYLYNTWATLMLKRYINWWIYAIWLKQLYSHPEILNSYFCLQHWSNNIDNNTSIKPTDDKQKDEFMHT